MINGINQAASRKPLKRVSSFGRTYGRKHRALAWAEVAAAD
jgi:hypothetical protein